MVRRLLVTMLTLAVAVAIPFAMADDKKTDAKKGDAEKAESKSSAEESDDDGDEKDGEKKDGDKKEAPKFTAKCPVSGEAASKEQAAAYRDKEVYFCCEKCKAAFEADSAKFASKANHQLVQTKQFVQTKCPLSGGDLNKEQFIRVSGVKVTFCCDKCKGSMAEASADDKIAKIFGDEVFAKSFEAKKPKKDGETEKKSGDGDKPKSEEKAKSADKK